MLLLSDRGKEDFHIVVGDAKITVGADKIKQNKGFKKNDDPSICVLDIKYTAHKGAIFDQYLESYRNITFLINDIYPQLEELSIYVNIKFCNQPWGLLNLNKIIRECQTISKLDIQTCIGTFDRGYSSAEVILKDLQTGDYKRLTGLKLQFYNGMYMDIKLLQYLEGTLQNLSNLSELYLGIHLQFIQKDGEVYNGIIDILKKQNHLKKLGLQLSDAYFPLSGTNFLLEVLGEFSNLTDLHLNLQHVKRRRSGLRCMHAVGEAIQGLPKLSNLYLIFNKFYEDIYVDKDEYSKGEILEKYLSNCKNLVHFSVNFEIGENFRLYTDDVIHLFKALGKCTKLESITLRESANGKLKIGGIEDLAEQLKDCVNLKTLKLLFPNRTLMYNKEFSLDQLKQKLAHLPRLTQMVVSQSKYDR